MELREPWYELSGADPARRDALASELAREIGPSHVLSGLTVEAVARRQDQDDVLFRIVSESEGEEYAVVHLTWSARTEAQGLPATSLYASLDDFIERCADRDADEFLAAGKLP